MSNKKTVPLYLGEGPDRIEIGTAELQKTSTGDFLVGMYMAGDWTEDFGLSGSTFIRGIIPARALKEAS